VISPTLEGKCQKKNRYGLRGMPCSWPGDAEGVEGREGPNEPGHPLPERSRQHREGNRDARILARILETDIGEMFITLLLSFFWSRDGRIRKQGRGKQVPLLQSQEGPRDGSSNVTNLPLLQRTAVPKAGGRRRGAPR